MQSIKDIVRVLWKRKTLTKYQFNPSISKFRPYLQNFEFSILSPSFLNFEEDLILPTKKIFASILFSRKPLTCREISEYIGYSLKTVNNSLAGLKQIGLIKVEKKDRNPSSQLLQTYLCSKKI